MKRQRRYIIYDDGGLGLVSSRNKKNQHSSSSPGLLFQTSSSPTALNRKIFEHDDDIAEYYFYVPGSANGTIFVTAAAGGGGGSYYKINTFAVRSGSGGNAGESVSKILFKAKENDKITVVVGRGGRGGEGTTMTNNDGEDGEDTKIYINDAPVLNLVGGRGGKLREETKEKKHQHHGDGKRRRRFSTDRKDFEYGESGAWTGGSLPMTIGGNGGKSEFGERGVATENNDVGLMSGTYGGGGAGLTPAAAATKNDSSKNQLRGGDGGDGFVLIEW